MKKTDIAVDQLLRAGVYVIGGYALVKVLQLVTGVGEGITKTVQVTGAMLASLGSAIGSGLFEILHPDTTGEMLFYTITFPDLKRHAIGSKTVNALGQFSYAGLNYQMLLGKDNLRYAVRI